MSIIVGNDAIQWRESEVVNGMTIRHGMVVIKLSDITKRCMSAIKEAERRNEEIRIKENKERCAMYALNSMKAIPMKNHKKINTDVKAIQAIKVMIELEYTDMEYDDKVYYLLKDKNQYRVMYNKHHSMKQLKTKVKRLKRNKNHRGNVIRLQTKIHHLLLMEELRYHPRFVMNAIDDNGFECMFADLGY